MRVLILGAGRAGRSIAGSLLLEANDITVVDINPQAIDELQHQFDLRAIVGDASSPKTLVEAGIEDADILLALTANDETNLVACLLAAKLFNVPTRIARIRKKDFAAYPAILSDEGFGATHTIWPESTLVEAVKHLIDYPEAIQVVDFVPGKASLVTVHVKPSCPYIGKRLSDALDRLKDYSVSPVALLRDELYGVVTGNTSLKTNDEITFLTTPDGICPLLSLFSPTPKKERNITIGGNLSLAFELCDALNEENKHYNIKLIDEEKNFEALDFKILPDNALLVKGHMTQEETLLANSIDTCDVFIALNRDDKVNIMSSLLAKKLGAKRVIAQIDNQTFASLVPPNTIDCVLSTTQTMLDELLLHVRHGDIVATHHLRKAQAEVLDVVAHGSDKNSKVVGRSVASLSLPKGAGIAGLIRKKGDTFTLLQASTNPVIEPDDHMIVFLADKRLLADVETLFAVDINFF